MLFCNRTIVPFVLFLVFPHSDVVFLFPNLLGGLSGLKISVKVLSLAFQAGVLGKQLFVLSIVDELPYVILCNFWTVFVILI